MMVTMIQDELTMHSDSNRNSNARSSSGRSDGIQMKLAQALTDKAELEVNYMQQIAFLEQGKGKIIQDLKRMLSTREKRIEEMLKEKEEQEMTDLQAQAQTLSMNVAVVSPEKVTTRNHSRVVLDPNLLPDDELGAEARIIELEDQLEDERDNSLRKIRNLELELEKVTEQLSFSLEAPNNASPSANNNKYAEKIRIAKANKRASVLEKQLSDMNTKIKSLSADLEETKKKEIEVKFELEAREVAIQLLADTKDKEIAAHYLVIADLKRKNDILRKDKDDILNVKDVRDAIDLQDQIRQSLEKNKKLETEFNEQKQSLESAKMIIASLEKSKQASINELKSKLVQHSNRISELENALDKNEEVVAAREELEKYKRQRLEEKMTAETEMSNLRQETLSGYSRLDEKDQEIDELKSKLEERKNLKKNENKGTVSQLRTLNESVNYIQLQIASNKLEASSELMAALEKAEAAAESAATTFRLDHLQNNADKEIDSKKNTAETINLEEQLKKSQIENNFMKVENTFLKSDKEEVVQNLKEQLLDAISSKERMKQQIASQLKQLEKAKEMIKKLENATAETVNTKEREITDLQSQMIALKSDTSKATTRRRSSSIDSRRSWYSMHEQLSSILPQCLSNDRDGSVEVMISSDESNEI